MSYTLEVIYDNNPSGGCGCNCGCGGSTAIEDTQSLIEDLQGFDFTKSLDVSGLPISDLDQTSLIEKINDLLNNSNAQFRVNETNIDETMSNILPLIVLDGRILTAYGIPSLADVVMEVEKRV